MAAAPPLDAGQFCLHLCLKGYCGFLAQRPSDVALWNACKASLWWRKCQWTCFFTSWRAFDDPFVIYQRTWWANVTCVSPSFNLSWKSNFFLKHIIGSKPAFFVVVSACWLLTKNKPFSPISPWIHFIEQDTTEVKFPLIPVMTMIKMNDRRTPGENDGRT